jgi:hypothetical protein
MTTARGRSSALPRTITAAAISAAPALIANERTGGGAASVKRTP